MSVQSVVPTGPSDSQSVPHSSVARARAYGDRSGPPEKATDAIKPLRLKNPVRLKSGPDVTAEKAAITAAKQSGHPPVFQMPSGAKYMASGPAAIAAKPSTAPEPGQAPQPQPQNG